VIVIHQGRKIYDGNLDRLDATGSRQKIIRFVPSGGGFPADWQPAFGTATRHAEGNVTLHVPSEQVVAVSQQILAAGPVADITIEDVPLEDIIADLFTSVR